MFILGALRRVSYPQMVMAEVCVIEGTLTCVVSVALFFLIADFPEEVKWLTPAEKAFVKKRLEDDVGDSQRNEKITPKFILSVITDCEYSTTGKMTYSYSHS